MDKKASKIRGRTVGNVASSMDMDLTRVSCESKR